MPLDVKAGDKVAWHWKLESGDINSTITFESAEKKSTAVYSAKHICNHESSFTATEDGRLFFFFDNSFSWVNGKKVIGMITVNE